MPRPTSNRNLVVTNNGTNSRSPRSNRSLVVPENGGKTRRPRSNNQLTPQTPPQQRRRPPPPSPNNQLVPHRPSPKPRRPNNQLVPHQPKPRRPNNQLVSYQPEEEYYDDDWREPRKPWGAQFCEPRCFLLLLLLLFFGVLLLVAFVLMILSIDKGDPANLAGYLYPVEPRNPDGYPVPQFGDKFGTSVSASGPFLAVSAPNRKNENGSTGAVFLYAWVGNFYAIYGDDGIMVPPEPDFEPDTWLPFLEDQQEQDRAEKEANRVNFDSTSAHSVIWAGNGERVFIGIPGSSSVAVYEFAHPLKESKYIASITVEAPYQEGGEIIQVSKDGNRVALTAKYNQTLDPSTRLLQEEDTLPTIVQVYDYLEANETWVKSGNPIVATAEEDIDGEFASSMVMSADGGTIAVSNPQALNGTGWIKVYQFDEDSSDWNQVGDPLTGKLNGQQYGFALDISADGSVVAGGAPFLDGAVYVYELAIRDFATGEVYWKEIGTEGDNKIGVILEGTSKDEMYGYSVSLSDTGTSMAVGCPGAHDGIGKIVLYEYFKPGDLFYESVELPQRDQYGNYDASGGFGTSVDLANNGDTLIVGAPNHTSEAEGNDYVLLFDKTPKGFDLTEWTTPPHVCEEHPNDSSFGC